MADQITVTQSGNESRIEWKITDFLKRSYFVSSDQFTIFNCKFCLKLVLFSDLSMQLTCYENAEINIEYTMGVKKIDGSELKTKKHFYKDCMLSMPDIDILSKRELLSLKDIMAPGYCLTVFCNVRLIEVIWGARSIWSFKALRGNQSNVSTQTEEKQVPDSLSNTSVQDGKGVITSGDVDVNEAVSTLTEDFKDLYRKQHYTDITMKVQNKEFHAHKSILAARSEVFACMFQHETSEKRDGVVEITDCDPDSFDDFLIFLYTGSLNIVSSKNVLSLYKTADKYGFKELMKKGISCMVQEMSTDNFCDFFQLAIMYNDSDLLTAATNFFIKNAKTIFMTTKWLALLERQPSLSNELLIKFSSTV